MKRLSDIFTNALLVIMFMLVVLSLFLLVCMLVDTAQAQGNKTTCYIANNKTNSVKTGGQTYTYDDQNIIVWEKGTPARVKRAMAMAGIYHQGEKPSYWKTTICVKEG